jgi:Reverse transcriptase (RNA-dependent DNA polymerase)
VERRAEELKNGAKEGTETVKEARDMGSINYGGHSMSAGGRSGETAAGRRRWTHDAVSRTFRKRAMYENLMDEVVGREPDAGLAGGDAKQGSVGDRPDEDNGTGESSSGALGKDPGEAAGGEPVPSPVRRVEILKPSGGTRMPGIPKVQDRLIQQMMLQVLTPVFDPQFSEHSYGFRPGRKAQDAVQAAQKYAREGKDRVVDIDITKFFDHVNYDILMGRIGKEIRDKRVLGLIGKFLRRGAMVEGIVSASEEGTPQGGPLSPLPANIYPDALDKELDQRGHSCCRHADDCNIYVNSQAAAERTPASIQNWIGKHLRLKVNEAKSGTGRVWERRFQGLRLNRKLQIGIAPESEAARA